MGSKRAKLGRPPRMDSPEKLTVLVPGELKRWLKVRAAETGQDMGDIVTAALMRERQRGEKP